MGYYIESKKVNITLNEYQQKEIFKIWDGIVASPEASPELKTLHMEWFIEAVNSQPDKNIETFLKELIFTYEKKSTHLKLKDFGSRVTYQPELFEKIAHLITPGQHVTFRGEDGAIFGWFFDGVLQKFDSYKELKKLQQLFELKKKLETDLEIKPVNTKMKI